MCNLVIADANPKLFREQTCNKVIELTFFNLKKNKYIYMRNINVNIFNYFTEFRWKCE